MNEGQFIAFRTYLEQIASDQRQLLKVQERTNELLNEIRLGVNRTDGRAKDIAEVVVPAVTGPIEEKPDPFIASVTQSVDTKSTPAKPAAKKGK